ncbi:MAG: DUF1015 domain-containing protein [Syntrophaceae bacterium]|nr:DUF1015 domain-containing protein [Syntrophaceae bacterium]
MLSTRARGDLFMAIVMPFKAIRPKKEFVDKIASLPYDVMTKEEGQKAISGNQLSFLRVEKSEIDVPEATKGNEDIIYQTAKKNINKIKKENIIQQDDERYFYIYRQRMGKRQQTGIVAVVSAAEYEAGIIKKHELTRKDKEEDRICHIEAVNAQTGPVFIAYRSNKAINKIVEEEINQNPEYDFVTEDKVKQTVWVIKNSAVIEKLKKEFASVEALYIADGHHRAAAATEVAKRKRKANNNLNNSKEYDLIMAVLFPDNELEVMDYNRAVKDLNGLNKDTFLKTISSKFIIIEDFKEKSPRKLHDFGMYLEGNWYLLSPKKETFDENDPINSLDVSILQSNLLAPVLGIDDPRTNQRIKFIGGIRGMVELEKLVDAGEYAVAFSLYPVTIEQIMKVADSGMIMPPKSTWFEPKLRSGIFVHSLD